MEERIAQVSVDDLASEGLLLIRMEPDEQGRYGFIVNVSGIQWVWSLNLHHSRCGHLISWCGLLLFCNVMGVVT